LTITLGEASPELIERWAADGKLPAFSRLMQEGSWGRLRCPLPLITPQMWGTALTGHRPGRHGAFDFLQRGPNGRFIEINGAWLKEPAIWKLLGDRGLRSGIVNVPFTYPPQRINGFMISGQDAPGAHRSIAQPAAVYDEVVRRFGRYRLKDIFPGGRKKEDYLTLIEEDVRKQTDVLEYLIAQKPWDFFLTFYSATAMAQHYFWGDMEDGGPDNPFRGVVETTYRCLDAAVDRLRAAAGPDAIVFVISECGAGSLQSGVSINAWLANEGFLTWAKRPSAARDAAAPARASSASPVSAVLKWAKRGLPPTLRFWANRSLGGVRVWLESRQADAQIDWAKTQAFSRGKEGDIFINLKGRDPRGTVAPGAEYDAVCRRITERLMALVDPETQQRPVERVYRADELFEGPWRAWAPDLTVAWRGTAYMPTEDDGDGVTVFVPRQRAYMDWPTTGSHRVDGFVFAAGPGIRRGAQRDGMGLQDLVPTWLHALRQPVPADLPGKPFTPLFTEGA
jgi:predicted AlkP superfamily phosphohydrolase/phosphomutase